MQVLGLSSLDKRYGAVTALDDVGLQLEAGTVLGLLGPNGAGKSTLMRLCLGLQRPDRGTVHLFGLDPSRQPQSALERVGASLGTGGYPHLSGRDALRVTAKMRSLPVSRVSYALEVVGLSSVAHRKSGTYSLGMKRRLEIARSLLSDPDLLILDEPTNGLDQEGAQDVLDLISGFAKRGKTVLLSSHRLDEVERVASHVAFLFDGRLSDIVDLRASTATSRALVVKASDNVEATALIDGHLVDGHNHIEVSLSEGDDEAAIASEIARKLVLADICIFELRLETSSLADLYAAQEKMGRAA